MKTFTLLSCITLAAAKYCHPGNIERKDCNYCLCTRDREWYCTEMDCSRIRRVNGLEISNETTPTLVYPKVSMTMSFGQAHENYTSNDFVSDSDNIKLGFSKVLSGLASDVKLDRVCVGFDCQDIRTNKILSENRIRSLSFNMIPIKGVQSENLFDTNSFINQVRVLVMTDLNSDNSIIKSSTPLTSILADINNSDVVIDVTERNINPINNVNDDDDLSVGIIVLIVTVSVISILILIAIVAAFIQRSVYPNHVSNEPTVNEPIDVVV